MITVHFCLESFDGRRGGMEESAVRIVNLLSRESDIRFVAYVTGAATAAPVAGVARLVNIAASVDALTIGTGITRAQLSAGRRARLESLFVRNAIREEIAQRPGDRHLVLSFYLSTAGFTGQLVASELKLPHIACSRGSDLGHNLFMSDRFGVIDHVIQRASLVVTTSKEHARFARDVAGRKRWIRTIYNSLPEHVRPQWHRHSPNQIRLISAGGYCFKKGTATLMASASRLIDEGLPVTLEIVGRTAIGSWRQIRQAYVAKYGAQMALRGLIDRSTIESFMLSGDIYCSASLSEGCSNALMLALGLGLPIVGTATGALLDFAADMNHVILVPPGDAAAFATALRQMTQRILAGEIEINHERLTQTIELLSSEREQAEWRRIIQGYHAPVGLSCLT